MKKVLIIGANGFVGRRILKHLTGKEYDLTAVSFMPTYSPNRAIGLWKRMSNKQMLSVS